MTIQLTPREDRIRVLGDRIAALTIELGRLLWAEEVGPRAAEPEAIPSAVVVARTNAARRRLLAWSWTPEFAARVEAYGGASGEHVTEEREAS